MPYAQTALADWLGGPVDHYCSERTARAMAMAAFERARELSDADPHTLRGIGATASLASNRPKRGPHRIHVAWQSADTTVAISCEFAKRVAHRARGRSGSRRSLILDAVAEACGVDDAPLAEPAVTTDIERREQRRAGRLDGTAARSNGQSTLSP